MTTPEDVPAAADDAAGGSDATRPVDPVIDWLYIDDDSGFAVLRIVGITGLFEHARVYALVNETPWLGTPTFALYCYISGIGERYPCAFTGVTTTDGQYVFAVESPDINRMRVGPNDRHLFLSSFGGGFLAEELPLDSIIISFDADDRVVPVALMIIRLLMDTAVNFVVSGGRLADHEQMIKLLDEIDRGDASGEPRTDVPQLLLVHMRHLLSQCGDPVEDDCLEPAGRFGLVGEPLMAIARQLERLLPGSD